MQELPHNQPNMPAKYSHVEGAVKQAEASGRINRRRKEQAGFTPGRSTTEQIQSYDTVWEVPSTSTNLYHVFKGLL